MVQAKFPKSSFGNFFFFCRKRLKLTKTILTEFFYTCSVSFNQRNDVSKIQYCTHAPSSSSRPRSEEHPAVRPKVRPFFFFVNNPLAPLTIRPTRRYTRNRAKQKAVASCRGVFLRIVARTVFHEASDQSSVGRARETRDETNPKKITLPGRRVGARRRTDSRPAELGTVYRHNAFGSPTERLSAARPSDERSLSPRVTRPGPAYGRGGVEDKRSTAAYGKIDGRVPIRTAAAFARTFSNGPGTTDARRLRPGVVGL